MATQQEIDWKHNDSIPHLSDVAHAFDPSGLVPYPCDHGVPVKPSRYPATRGIGVWRDADGNERPPYAGQSWGRAKYLRIPAFGGQTSVDSNGKKWYVPYAHIKCVICLGEPVPDDFYTTADGVELDH